MATPKPPLGLTRALRRLVIAAPIALVTCAHAPPPPPPPPPVHVPALPTCETSIEATDWRRGDEDPNRMVGFDGALPWRRCTNSGLECAVDILDSFASRDEIEVGQLVRVGESLVLGIRYAHDNHNSDWRGERIVFDIERHARSHSTAKALAKWTSHFVVDRRGGVHALLADHRYAYLPPRADAWAEQVVVTGGYGNPITQLVLDSRDRPVVIFNDVAYRPPEANDPAAGWTSTRTELPGDALIIEYDGRGRGLAMHHQASPGGGYSSMFRGRGDGSWQEESTNEGPLPGHVFSDAFTGRSRRSRGARSRSTRAAGSRAR